MKIGQMLASVSVLQKLIEQPLHLRQAHTLSKIARKINEELAFFAERRDQILNSDMTDEEKEEKMNELVNFETDWDLAPLKLNLDQNIELSAADLDVVVGIVEVEEEE